MTKTKTARTNIAVIHERLKTLSRSRICFLLVLGGLLLVTGCATLYQAGSDNGKRPQMSLFEARQNIKLTLQRATVKHFRAPLEDPRAIQLVLLTNEALSFKDPYETYFCLFRNIAPLVVRQDIFSIYVDLPPFTVMWQNKDDAVSFADSFQAMKYYGSKQFLDDDAADFADFQGKAKIWRSLAPKPPLPEEARRFRVLAKDAQENKDFEREADFYEKGLAIDPLWPAGQFNAAVIYEALKNYRMAVIHMKRYLELEPGDKDAKSYRDQLYIWEQKASDANAVFENTTSFQSPLYHAKQKSSYE
jgi:tetratricopeptide (TPR) repeat protein